MLEASAEDMYRYKQLRDGEIRLLQCQRHTGGRSGGDSNDPAGSHLQGFIQSFASAACPRYAALSYCWGTDQPSECLVLNGEGALLRNNLYRLLCRLSEDLPENTARRHNSGHFDDQIQVLTNDAYNLTIKESPRSLQEVKDAPGFIWTDALCIDQQNIAEKNVQLGMLGEIYAKAERIIIWLGESDESSRAAFNAWRSLARWARSNPQDRPDLELSPDECRALEDLREREYWRRVWIWQEASTPMVPRDIWCGDERIAFEDAVLANDVARQWLLALNRIPEANPWNTELEGLNTLSHIRQTKRNMGPSDSLESTIIRGWDSLLSMLYTTLDLQATNPRDKIYALLSVYADIRNLPLNQIIYRIDSHARGSESSSHRGNWPLEEALIGQKGTFLRVDPELSHWDHEAPPQNSKSYSSALLRIDYDLPLEETSRESAIFMLIGEQDLRTLLLCSMTGPRASIHTWIPNFRNISQRFNLFDYCHLFNASPNAASEVTLAQYRNKVTLRGILLDEVASVHPPLTATGDSLVSDPVEFGQQRFAEWIQSIARFIFPKAKERRYLGIGSLSQAVDRLLALHCAPGMVLTRSDSVTHWGLLEIAAGGQVPRIDAMMTEFTDLLLRVSKASLFWTRGGFLGLGDPSIRGYQRDYIVVFDGLSIPVVIRDAGAFNMVVGPAFVQGIMDGELSGKGYQSRNFTIH
ncbi:hypothetical protein JX265_007452 [Neoarthrinium moseri]|uniref:Heterokaryon incompatibility domain-containing protein n=1 Tax=Neoarthrinium moseri TaxID=1658444 RepID=A0A9Q0APP0_9PEZI|nr:hypothetical protein JX265_007452 [Neoarthrinium moseri]